jgi:hypothetical protein
MNPEIVQSEGEQQQPVPSPVNIPQEKLNNVFMFLLLMGFFWFVVALVAGTVCRRQDKSCPDARFPNLYSYDIDQRTVWRCCSTGWTACSPRTSIDPVIKDCDKMELWNDWMLYCGILVMCLVGAWTGVYVIKECRRMVSIDHTVILL